MQRFIMNLILNNAPAIAKSVREAYKRVIDCKTFNNSIVFNII